MDSSDDHAQGKHARRTSRVNPNSVFVRLSPELTLKLGDVETAVHDSAYFSPEIHENLNEYAEGKPFVSVGAAFIAIATITRETMKHAQETGDKHAEDALNSFISRFIELQENQSAFTLEYHKRDRTA